MPEWMISWQSPYANKRCVGVSPNSLPSAGPALPAGPDSSTSDEQILDPQPLDELRERAEFDADFSISSFIDLFLEEAPKTLARAVTALQEADVELSIGMCTR